MVLVVASECEGLGVGWVGFSQKWKIGGLRGGDVERDGRYPIHATRPIARPANTTIKKIDQPDMAAIAVSVLIERVGGRCSCEGLGVLNAQQCPRYNRECRQSRYI